MARNGRNARSDTTGSDSPVVGGTARGDSDGSGNADGVGGTVGNGGGTLGTGVTDGSESRGSDSGSGVGTSDSGRSVDDAVSDTGTDAGTGSGIDSGDGSDNPAKRRRGRPRKDASNGETVVASDAVRVRRLREPKPIALNALGLGGESGNIKPKDAYTGGAKLLFAVPKYAGLGQHWALDDDEADDLGGAIQAFVKTLPKSQRNKWEKKLEKYWPGLNLAVVAGMITIPRVMATVELAKMQRMTTLPSFSPEPASPYGEPSSTSQGTARVDLRDVVERS